MCLRLMVSSDLQQKNVFNLGIMLRPASKPTVANDGSTSTTDYPCSEHKSIHHLSEAARSAEISIVFGATRARGSDC
jgi:hypothetical protein